MVYSSAIVAIMLCNKPPPNAEAFTKPWFSHAWLTVAPGWARLGAPSGRGPAAWLCPICSSLWDPSSRHRALETSSSHADTGVREPGQPPWRLI